MPEIKLQPFRPTCAGTAELNGTVVVPSALSVLSLLKSTIRRSKSSFVPIPLIARSTAPCAPANLWRILTFAGLVRNS